MQFLVKAELIQKADGRRTHKARRCRPKRYDARADRVTSLPLRGNLVGLTNLSGANLSLANLSDADLSSADLRRSYVVEANLNKANMIGA
jgi:uncharacterized protein YjbI with pentapeptide repeats